MHTGASEILALLPQRAGENKQALATEEEVTSLYIPPCASSSASRQEATAAAFQAGRRGSRAEHADHVTRLIFKSSSQPGHGALKSQAHLPVSYFAVDGEAPSR